MSRVKKIIYGCVLPMLLALGACQTRPPSAVGGLHQFRQADFAEQYQQIAQHGSWNLKGAFRLVNQDDNVQGKVLWHKTGQQVAIQLFGPLGAGAVKLQLEPNVAQLQQGKKVYRARHADELMQSVLGWSMPVDSLNYWVFGLAAPKQSARYRLNETGNIAELQQSGWVIQFKQYRQVAGFVLPMPRKIVASHLKNSTDIKLVVTQISP